MDKSLISYVLKYFSYNPVTGKITRTDRANSNGSLDKDGYLVLKIKGKQYKAHRIAWLIYNKCMPKMVIDHINGDRLDNSISNLRDVSQRENIKNIKRLPNKDTGVVGVYLDKNPQLKKRYCTRINGKTYRFYSLSDAINFRRDNGY